MPSAAPTTPMVNRPWSMPALATARARRGGQGGANLLDDQ